MFRKNRNVKYFLGLVPGKKRLGTYRFLPIFFCIGGVMEWIMINVRIGRETFCKYFSPVVFFLNLLVFKMLLVLLLSGPHKLNGNIKRTIVVFTVMTWQTIWAVHPCAPILSFCNATGRKGRLETCTIAQFICSVIRSLLLHLEAVKLFQLGVRKSSSSEEKCNFNNSATTKCIPGEFLSNSSTQRPAWHLVLFIRDSRLQRYRLDLSSMES